MVKRIYPLMLFCLIGLGTLYGQNQDSISSNPIATKQRMAIGLGLGTQGISLDFAVEVFPSLHVRAAYNYMEFQLTDYELRFSVFETYPGLIDMSVKRSNFQLNADYAPFKKRRLRFTAGVSYFPNEKIKISGQIKEDFHLNDIVLRPEHIGIMDITYHSRSKIIPYLGIGLGKLIPNKSFSLSVDVGAYYLGHPDLTLEATGLIAPNVENEVTLEKNLSPYLKFWPVASVRFAIKL